jgi:hypothetical protein
MASLIALRVPTHLRNVCVRNVTTLLPSVTKVAVRLLCRTGCVTFFVMTIAFSARAADILDPLELASKEAAELCLAAGAESLERCTAVRGRTASVASARVAVSRFYRRLDTFLTVCKKERRPGCLSQAEWHVQVGLAAAQGPHQTSESVDLIK